MTVTRALGHTSDRLALWQVEALVEDMAGRYELDDTSARLLVLDRLASLAPVLEAQLVHSYRRQLAAIAGRYAGEFGQLRAPVPRAPPCRSRAPSGSRTWCRSRAAPPGSGRPISRSSCSASRPPHATSSPRPVGAWSRPSATPSSSSPTAPAPVRSSRSGWPRRWARSSTSTARPRTGGLFEGARGVTPVRVGLVWGRVLSRFGDVFGPDVNLAARLTDIAEPSTVLVDAATAEVLSADARFVLEPRPVRRLAGIGSVHPVRLRAAGS